MTNVTAQSIDGIREEIGGIREEIETLSAQVYELEHGFLSIDEATESIDKAINAKRDEFQGHQLMDPLVRYGRRPSELQLFKIETRSGPHTYGADLAGLLCFLFGDEIKTRLFEVAESIGLPKGPSAKERPEMIRKLAAEIHGLEQREEALIVSAQAAGIQIARHPDARAEIILEWHD